MNQMFDIYNNYADLYDELVNHEDYKNNLRTFLNDNGEVLPYFYEKLEQYGFKKNIIETDYKFSDYKEASRIMGAFFGDNMKNNILSNKSNIIKEYTGIWNRTIALTGRCALCHNSCHLEQDGTGGDLWLGIVPRYGIQFSKSCFHQRIEQQHHWPGNTTYR